MQITKALVESSRILFIDTETTGLEQHVDIPIELGWCLIVNGVATESGTRFLKASCLRDEQPGDGTLTQRFIDHMRQVEPINHITPDMLENGCTLEEAIAGLPAADYYAAHNAPYDRGMIRPHFAEESWIDTKTEATRILGVVRRETSLSKVAAKLGINITETLHRADADCRLGAEVLIRLAQEDWKKMERLLEPTLVVVSPDAPVSE